jgi:hypothetical protein
MPVAFDESKAAGGTPAARTGLVRQAQQPRSIGGALNTGISAILLFNILFEPPFVDGLSIKREFITAPATRQANCPNV